MRTYTLVFSIVVHAAIACAVLFSTVLATDELPEPRRASVFVEVFSTPPPTPPPPARNRVVPPAPVAAIPVVAPVGIQPEVERPVVLEAFEAPAGVIGGLDTDSGALLRDEPPPPPVPLMPSGPVRAGGDVQAPKRLVYVKPVYPGIALASRVSGVVILEATIGEDGMVREVRPLRSYPLLDQAAIDAVRQWRYTPTLLNGRPVSVLMTVTVSFSLD